MTSSWFFLPTLNYDARSTTHQIYRRVLGIFFFVNYAFIFVQQLRQWRTSGEHWNTKWFFCLGYVRLVLLSDTRRIVQVWNKFLDCGSIQLGIFYCHLQEINCSVLTDFLIIIIIINIIIISIIRIIRFQFFNSLFSLWVSKIKIKKLLVSLLFLVQHSWYTYNRAGILCGFLLFVLKF